MKILWIVNILFPYPAKYLEKNNEVLEGWLSALHEDLVKNRNLKMAIATVYEGNELIHIENNNTEYYLVPCKNKVEYDSNVEEYWKKVTEQFKPDVVHLHGSEFPHGLAYLNACPNIISITSIQGILSECAKFYSYGIDSSVLNKPLTIKDFIKKSYINKGKEEFENRAIYEEEQLKKSNYVIGRTDWDFSIISKMTDSNKYLFCGESLRKCFYSDTWNPKNIKNHSILMSQASYPLKGLHHALKIVYNLKKEYSDVKLYIGGENIYNTNTFIKKLKLNSYASYILKQIKKLKLEDNIYFLGKLSAEEMKEQMLRCNVYLQSSNLENSPNSLGEAMLLSVPCVASNVGGTATILMDKEEGYLYDLDNIEYACECISNIFENKNLALKMGATAHKHAIKIHDRNKNYENMLAIYKKVVEKRGQ